ncbi:MAG: DUF4301 family protein [Rikenellaceae bacterium]
MFTTQDLEQIKAHGIDPQSVEQQIKDFEQGFPSLPVLRAASVGDGIIRLSESELKEAIKCYDNALSELKVVKFVPASGAATRMFKELFEFVGDDKRTKGIDYLLENIERFAFWPELKALLPEGADDKAIVSAIIGEGLGYGSKPKGLVTFHSYESGNRKAIEEHLVEAAIYGANKGVANIHFTVSPEHRAAFSELLDSVVPRHEATFGVKYNISFSEQSPATDTVAVNPDNTLFRTNAGSLLFRPAGHGALIENLNAIDADLIFIKNIDNVTTDALRGDTVAYKKALGGVLLSLLDRTFEYIKALEVGGAELEPIAQFIEQSLCVKLPEDYGSATLRSILERPMRVCAMVLNEGEPGGGPYWVKEQSGMESLQIAESSQISADDAHLMKSATHFNPADLICAVKDSRGQKFNLRDFVDYTTGFISEKSSEGRALRAQELPGLWNGSMAKWNTIFVEVPVSTFSPVKIVQDLLRDQHQ